MIPVFHIENYLNSFRIIPEKKDDQKFITYELYQRIFYFLDFHYSNDIIRFHSKNKQIYFLIDNQKCLIDFSRLE